ncbi:acyl-CoA N-acyltransferase [Zopfia rhizophila CBS 207.26]|uniref:Acyl-CoA N-acyltransferase n=1 Tax=Zopfia rhizophila CBS 207.26 TaxID=1314779 RepID=A0A6A6DRE4_9PEZI|nr:acyl-CoA N-acyltransferase [Zopfia rhizophila CBS 207.26]
MTVRPACYSDMPAMAAVAARAFHDDELFGTLMHPFRAQYPDDYEAFFLRRMRENWWDWSHVWWVATIDDEVVGIAEWEMKGRVKKRIDLAAWDLRRVMMPTVKVIHALSLRIRPSPAANPDPRLRDPFPAAHRFFEHHWTGSRADTVYLELLAVDPRFQGRGLAKELVQWGLDYAKEEGVCASVIASESGYEFYKRMGYTVQVGHATEGEGNPLAGLKSGWILFTDHVEQDADEKAKAKAKVTVREVDSDP